MEKKLEEALKSSALFQGFGSDFFKFILPYMKTYRYQKGKEIVYQGEESSDLFIILEGQIRASIFDDEGNELVIDIFGEGDFVGELSLIDGEPRSASLIAETDVVVAVLERKHFISILKKYPELCLKLAENLVYRLRKADKFLESLAFLDVKERIINLFIDNAVESGNQIYKIPKMSHREIAKRIGASRESVTKALKRFSELGILSEENNMYILNLKEKNWRIL
ncbi:Crp/Fnr family transcriptional regulator [Persephonella sp.]